MIKAVLDTTVFVAAMLRPEPEGISATLLELAAEGRYEFYLSDDILEETAANLAASERNRRRYKYSDEHIVAYCGTVIFDIPNLTGIVRDLNDDMIVACAVAANADFLVSRDKDLLTIGSYEAINMVAPESFLHILPYSARGEGRLWLMRNHPLMNVSHGLTEIITARPELSSRLGLRSRRDSHRRSFIERR